MVRDCRLLSGVSFNRRCGRARESVHTFAPYPRSAGTDLTNNTSPKPAVFDVSGAAAFLGTTEKALRRQVERGRVPFRRLGRKLIFLQPELAEWLRGLPGLTLSEVQAMRERRGDTSR